MTEVDMIDLISRLGFPIVITLWFMFRMEKVINKNTDILLTLKDLIEERVKLTTIRRKI